MSTLAAGSVALPLADEQIRRVDDAVAGLSPGQLRWLSGYIAGLGAGPSPISEVTRALTILYGSQTGNGEGIASLLAKEAEEQGYAATLRNMGDYEPRNLKRETLVAFVVSTHGEGDPPDDAELFHEFMLSTRAPNLTGLRYAVLALGDSSYVNFCQTGREIDARLVALGAERLRPLLECDLDFEDVAETWRREIVDGLDKWLDTVPTTPQLRAVETRRYGKGTPFAARVLVNQQITGRGSTKDVRHIELSIEGSGFTWEPGDSLAVAAVNPPDLVRQFLEFFDADADREVCLEDDTITLGEALSQRLEITATNPAFLRAWADHCGSLELESLFEDGRQGVLQEFLGRHQVIDILLGYPVDIGVEEFLAMLRKLSPRSYSIASSHRANPDEVHLTVAAIRYEAFGRAHWGAASTHVVDRVLEGETVSVYVDPNSRFRLTADDSADIIMIGPGTGVAPFRAFVEDRAERGASGRNWLFFGDRNFSRDFLYQVEWQRHLVQGRLDRLDVAFSRDQEDKVYVQDRIRERAGEIWSWIDAGAFIYVCGDAARMAGDVNEAFIDVIASQADIAREDAVAKLAKLRRDGRYRRDVY